MSLIERCLCELPVDSQFEESFIHDIRVLTCLNCGLVHQVVHMDKQQLLEFYSKDYHTTFQDGTTQGPYIDRFQHDKHIAYLRLKEYEPYLTSENTRLLDIGSGNGAFVYESSGRGYESYGLEPGKKAYLSFLGQNIVNKSFEDCTLADFCFEERFGVVVMHDVMEHLVNPVSTLHRIKDEFLEDDGVLIVDIPDYYTPEGEHHWRPVQHLWFWTKDQALRMFTDAGFRVIETKTPVPGKLVFYLGCRNYKE